MPNRVVLVILFVCGVAAAALPAAANLDWTSTAGVLGGLAAIATAIVTFVRGWQQWEQTQTMFAENERIRAAAMPHVHDVPPQ